MVSSMPQVTRELHLRGVHKDLRKYKERLFPTSFQQIQQEEQENISRDGQRDVAEG